MMNARAQVSHSTMVEIAQAVVDRHISFGSSEWVTTPR